MRSRFLAIRVRPANREPANYWLSTLPETTPIKTHVTLTALGPGVLHPDTPGPKADAPA